MANNNIETIDQMLEKKYSKKLNEKPSKAKTKKKKKGLILAIIAGVLAVITAISGFIAHFSKKKKDDLVTPTDISTSSISTIDLEDLGTKLEFESEIKPEYGKVTGNVDINKIVEKDGTIYADKESADKSDKVGNVSVDTKNNTLKVESNGTVVEKSEGYEIIDKNGTVIDSGEGKIPSDFEYNENLNGNYEKKDETSNLVYADSDYYNEEGNCVITKGSVVSKETLEYAKKNLSTTKPSTKVNSTVSSNISSTISSSTTSSSEVTSSSTSSNNTSSTVPSTPTTSKPTDQGVVNEDGTYTIDGITYLSKADYEQCIIDGYEGYAIIDGIMQPIANYENQIQKVK